MIAYSVTFGKTWEKWLRSKKKISAKKREPSSFFCVSMHVKMISYRISGFMSPWGKMFASLLANRFSAAMQKLTVIVP